MGGGLSPPDSPLYYFFCSGLQVLGGGGESHLIPPPFNFSCSGLEVLVGGIPPDSPPPFFLGWKFWWGGIPPDSPPSPPPPFLLLAAFFFWGGWWFCLGWAVSKAALFSGVVFSVSRTGFFSYQRWRFASDGHYPKDPTVLKILRRSKWTLHSKFTIGQ